MTNESTKPEDSTDVGGQVDPFVRWIPCSERLPPIPETPFKVYLVWAVVNIVNGTGTHYLVQFCRETGRWMPVATRMGDPCTVTHWSEVLDMLGAPDPKPFGPRFTLTT